MPGQSARSSSRYARVQRSAALGAARRSGRGAGGRNARPGNHSPGADRGGNRPSGVRHPAYQFGGEDHRPHRRCVPGGRKRHGPCHDVGELAGRDLADLDEARRRRPYCGARNHDRHARHPQLDPRGQNRPNVFRHPDRPGSGDANPGSMLAGIGAPKVLSAARKRSTRRRTRTAFKWNANKPYG